MHNLKEKAELSWRRIVVFTRRMRHRSADHTMVAPVSRSEQQGQSFSGSGNPLMDAIRGNALQAQLWGIAGAPPPEATLKTCNDGGAELLSEARNEISSGQVSADPPAVFSALAGSQFPPEDSFNRPQMIESGDIEDGIEDDPEAAAREKLDLMDQALRTKSLVPPFEGPRFWIPQDSLFDIMTREAIRAIIPAIAKDVVPDSRFDELAWDIAGRKGQDGNLISYRRVLATLILIGKPGTMCDFLKHGLSDANLPFLEHGPGRPFQLRLKDKEGILRLFKSWEARQIEEFESKQWETLAPYFSMATKPGVVLHYVLFWRRPLPFEILPDAHRISNAETRASSSTSAGSNSSMNPARGGHGRVYRVRIHPKHHNLPSYRGNEENPAFAVKRLLTADRAAFRNEVNILTRLNRCDDPHLVKLLFTMEIVGRPGNDKSFYLVFPLADCNLRQFWQRHYRHPPGFNAATYSCWAARQFYGLVLALCKLHNLYQIHQKEVQQSAREGEEPTSRTGDPFYGIHGDIKPENLLWYSEWIGPQGTLPTTASESVKGKGPENISHGPLGVLQLADFGISKLHHTDSKSDTAMRGATKTYAPPEIEWAVDHCSRSFDIWGLGCVFLEFICWLVQGGSGVTNPVDAFHEARYLHRENRSLENTIQDTFYHVVKGTTKTTFEVNPAVTRLIKRLRKGASQFIVDILDIILDDMLVVEPKKSSDPVQVRTSVNTPASQTPKLRITCFDLAEKLKGMQHREQGYFTKPGAKDKTTKTTQAFTIHEPAGTLLQRRYTTRL